MATSEETVRIRLDDGCYAVSRRKLVEQSDYFRALFRSGMREARRADEQQLRGLSAPGLRLVLDFISSGGAWQPPADDVPLSELVEAASFLQVTSLLRLLLSRVHLHNCPELYGLAQVYGLWELRDACLRFMTVPFHEVLCQPHFHHLLASPQHPGDASLKQTLRDERMKGTPVLVALGDFLGGPLAPHPDQRDPPSMLRYDEVTDRWLPLASNLPSDLVNVRSYGSAVLDNYLFIVGGSRITSQDIAAAHSYNPSNNEWLQVASMNQKRSNFKLVAVSSKLYAIGGQAMSNVECYSPEQDAWNFVAPLPSPLAEFSACECKGKIYVIGGYTTRERNMGVLQYCPSADAWTLFGTCDVHLRKQQMLSAGDTIYAVGGCVRAGPGRGAGGEDALAVHAFDTAARRWRPLGEPARASGLGVACALHGAGVYVLSREATPTPAGARACVLLTFDLASGRWGAARRPPAAHAAPARGRLVCSLRLPAAADA